MTCNDKLQNYSYYYLLNQALHKPTNRFDWSTQVWIMEPVPGKQDYYTFKSCWTPPDGTLKGQSLYLTQNTDWKTDNGKYYQVFVQAKNDGWSTQKWKLE